MLTQKRLKELLSYSPIVGVFEWRKNRAPVRAGSIAGNVVDTGYITIGVDYKVYTAHRLAWLYMTGSFPDGEIDHADGDRTNNAWNNLREVSKQQNAMNARIGSNNTSGVKGVLWCRKSGKWRGRICTRGKLTHLGPFNTIEEAAEAVRAARVMLHGEFANHGKHKYEIEEESA